MKETLDILFLVRAVSDAIEKAKKDGKLDWFDISHLGPLKPYVKKAVEGSQKIPGELMDLNTEEIKILLEALLKTMEKLYRAITGK